MSGPSTVDEFLKLTVRSGVIALEPLKAALAKLREAGPLPGDAKQLAGLLVKHGVLTYFQAEQLLKGKWRGFTVGQYQLLERIGAGGMGIVYLCEHKVLRRRVAIKFLPALLAGDPRFLEFFYREAEAIAAVDHPNIVHAFDVGHEGKLHYLVMEYVEGLSLQEIVNRNGPLDVLHAAHYIRQTAGGLQHAHERGLVHRDVKPDNLLLARQGVVKILDMGLAHFFRPKQATEAANQGPRHIVGTDDYLAPEQIVNSDEVDVRADVYSLGATFYFLLTGRPPFHGAGSGYQKLLQHLGRRPTPVQTLNPEVCDEVAAIVDKMMAKNPWERYQTPAAVIEVLAAWTKTPIPPPGELEMPWVSPAARLSGFIDPTRTGRSSSKGSSSWVLPQEARGSNPKSGPPPDTSGSDSSDIKIDR